jgi:hypothetical protein
MTVAAKRKLKAERPRVVSAHEAAKKPQPRVRLVRNEERRRKAARRAQRHARRAW